MIRREQLLHDVLAWTAAGQSPHAVPGPWRPGQVGHYVEALLAVPPPGSTPAEPLLLWSRQRWGYELTAAGVEVLGAWDADHPRSPEVVAALADLAHPAEEAPCRPG